MGLHTIDKFLGDLLDVEDSVTMLKQYALDREQLLLQREQERGWERENISPRQEAPPRQGRGRIKDLYGGDDF